MGPPLTDAELAKLYPHLTVEQRQDLERWHRGKNHALMKGLPLPTEPPPWPETADDRRERFTETTSFAKGSGIDLEMTLKPGEPGFMEELARKTGSGYEVRDAKPDA